MKIKSNHNIKPDKKNEADEWKNKYLRALADYQNLDRRVREEKEKTTKFAAKDFVLKFLPIVDDLLKAQKELENPGIDLIVSKIDQLLKEESVERVTSLHKKFDPSIMECVEVVENNQDDKVIEEIRPAYKMNGQVIRTALVVVGKKKHEIKNQKEEENSQNTKDENINIIN